MIYSGLAGKSEQELANDGQYGENRSLAGKGAEALFPRGDAV